MFSDTKEANEFIDNFTRETIRDCKRNDLLSIAFTPVGNLPDDLWGSDDSPILKAFVKLTITEVPGGLGKAIAIKEITECGVLFANIANAESHIPQCCIILEDLSLQVSLGDSG